MNEYFSNLQLYPYWLKRYVPIAEYELKKYGGCHFVISTSDQEYDAIKKFSKKICDYYLDNGWIVYFDYYTPHGSFYLTIRDAPFPERAIHTRTLYSHDNDD
jgi:hypothetical protein